MDNKNSKKLNTPRNILNILGIISIALLYLTSILLITISLMKPSYDDIFTNNKTGIWYGFSEIVKNTNGSTSLFAEATESMTKVYISNLEWGLNVFGIVVIAFTCTSLVFAMIVCLLFKLNCFHFNNSKSLTIWNLGLPITLVIYSFILAMLATPFNNGVWTLTITKNGTDITTSLNANNGPILDVTNYFALVIDKSKVTSSSASSFATLAPTNNLTYSGSLESNYSSGSMSILLFAILIYGMAIPFVSKLAIKLNKEFKGIENQQ